MENTQNVNAASGSLERLVSLPEWNVCEAGHDAGTANPIEEFIWSNEPANDNDSDYWRRALLAALNHARQANMRTHAPKEEH